MANLQDILSFINDELDAGSYKDASLNGLQVESNEDIKVIASSVDSGLSVIEDAAEHNADILLVHHGLFWGSPIALSGSHKKIVKTLFDAKMNLVAQHLPLDASEKYGNNYSIARLLQLKKIKPCGHFNGKAIGCIGENSQKKPFSFFADTLKRDLDGAANMHTFNFGLKTPEKICVVSGAAADQLYHYKNDGFDTFIGGEPKQFAYHFCKDNGINAIFAGHYATETVGVKNISQAVADKFNLKHVFINHPTGI